MIKKIFNNNFDRIKKDIRGSKYPDTAKALFRFYEKIVIINSIINKIIDTSEVYGAKILLRVLFEHLIVSYYILEKCSADKNDTVGSEYYKEYKMHEFFKQKGYSQKIDNIRANRSKNINGLEYIKSKYPELEDVSEKQYNEINKIGNQFKIDNILKYLNQVTLKNKLHDYMLGFLDMYNKLSSFVHGGAFSEEDIFDLTDNLDDELQTIKDWGETSVDSNMKFIFRFLGNEHSYYLEQLKPFMITL